MNMKKIIYLLAFCLLITLSVSMTSCLDTSSAGGGNNSQNTPEAELTVIPGYSEEDSRVILLAYEKAQELLGINLNAVIGAIEV